MATTADDRNGSEVEESPRIVVKRRPGRSPRLLVEACHLTAAAGPGVVPLERVVSRAGEIELHLTRAEGSLADVLRDRGPLPENEVRAVGVLAATALGRLHESGLVHADVKPANLLLHEEGGLWLADLDATVPADGRPLRRGSPGRLRTGALADPSADVISLAVALVELATGAIPDPGIAWSRSGLARIDCPVALARDLESVLGTTSPPSASELADSLRRDGLRLPRPAEPLPGSDPTPTIDFDPVVIIPDVRPGRADPGGPSTSLLAALALLVLVVVIGLAIL